MKGDNESGLLDLIYAAAWDPAALDEALLGVAQSCRSRSAGLFRLCDGALAWEQSCNMPDGFMGDFVANAVPHDPRVHAALAQPPLTMMRDDDPGMRRAMCMAGIDEFTRHYDLPYTMSCVLDRPGPTDALALYVSRGADDSRPHDRQMDAFARYAPHFARAMALRGRIRADLLTDTHARTSIGQPRLGVLALDRHRRVRWLDGGAENLLDTCNSVTLSGAQLRFDDSATARHFDRLIDTLDRQQALSSNDVLRIVQSHPSGLLTLRLLPNPAPSCGIQAPALLLLRYTPTGAGARSPSPMPTPRQGEVLTLLAQGLMSKQIGAHLGITENTVRNHVHGLLQLFEVSTRTACIARARAYGLVD